jgi:outer membrane receptor for ferrienterochelin and colicin
MRRSVRRAAALVCLGLWTFAQASPARADERTDARREFRRGMQKVRAGDYDGGLKALRRAYAILPHPDVLFNIALSSAYAQRFDDAWVALESFRTSALREEADELARRIGELARAAGLVADAAHDDEPAVEAPAPEVPSPATEAPPSVVTPAREAQAPAPPPRRPQPRAEGLAAEQEKNVYAEQVVSTSRFKEAPLDAPNAISIITAQDIRLTGLTNLADLLRRVAGVEVAFVTPTQAEVSVRGLNRRTSNKMLLLVDGRSMRQDFIGANWYNFIPFAVEDIERIEVIRGPASALYGADAFSGIVNVITRAPGDGKSYVTGGYGNHGQARAGAGFSGRRGDFAYRSSFGYQQAYNSALLVDPARVDVENLQRRPELAVQRLFMNGEARYAPRRDTTVSVGGAAISGEQVQQALGRIQQIAIRNGWTTHTFFTAALPRGFKLGAWWNHLRGDSGPVSVYPGGVNLTATGTRQDVADADLSWSGSGRLLVPHTFTAGLGYRFKRIDWSWLDRTHEQHHYAAYLEDVAQLLSRLRFQLSARVDRHPLLTRPQFSPRGSLVYRLAESQSLRATVGRAFRGPSFAESYTYLATDTPVRAVTGLGMGNTRLAPESIISYELGYLNQASDYVAFEASVYVNTVKNLIILSDLYNYTLTDFGPDGTDPAASYWDEAAAFPLGRLRYANQAATYRQLGGELGVRIYPVHGVDVYVNYAVHDTTPLSTGQMASPVLKQEQQTSLHKLNAGVQYRAPFGLDLSVDLHWQSAQLWAEQVFDAARGVRFAAFAQPALVIVNARAGYRLLRDTLELGVVGQNLTHDTRRQHPLAQPMDTRLLGTATLRF